MSKIRSRKYRKRKNDYIEKLEDKNRNLEQEVTKLRDELSACKNLLLVKGCKPNENDEEMKFLMEENYMFNEFISLMESNPKMVKMTMFDQISQNSGTNSESRK